MNGTWKIIIKRYGNTNEATLAIWYGQWDHILNNCQRRALEGGWGWSANSKLLQLGIETAFQKLLPNFVDEDGAVQEEENINRLYL